MLNNEKNICDPAGVNFSHLCNVSVSLFNTFNIVAEYSSEEFLRREHVHSGFLFP